MLGSVIGSTPAQILEKIKGQWTYFMAIQALDE